MGRRGLVDAFVVADVSAAGDDEANALTAVVRTAAAQRDDAVALILQIGLHAITDINVGWVRFRPVVDRRAKASIFRSFP